MAYLAQQLITRAWYLSGIIARNLQTPTGDQITDGLMLLNALLDFKQIETDLIPYWTYIEVPLVANQEYYFLPYVSGIESATFNIDPVRYPMDSVTRRNYYGSARVDNISSLPFSWNYNRGEGGGTLAMYFLPESNYPLKLMVKMFLNDVSLNTDLTNVFSLIGEGYISSATVTSNGSGYTTAPTVTISAPSTGGTQATAVATISNGSVSGIIITNIGGGYATAPTITITGGGGVGAAAQANIGSYTFLTGQNAGFDTSYIEYLRYALAQYMCSEYGIQFNPESAAILKKYERKLMFMSPPDLSMIKVSTLMEGTGLNYGDVNIGKGWRPN